jgi:[acyl-carrier-protein] S-malonyltransferase
LIAWMFPGQGSQKAGMGLDIAGASELFRASRSVVNRDLERLCTTDPDPAWAPDVLQPALFVTEVAIGRKMQALGLEPGAVVGHSLGEFPALVIAGAMEFEEALRLVALRGKAMADAGRRNEGGMAAVIGLDPEKIGEICAAEGDVWVSNYNSPQQTVISGKDRGLAEAAKRCMEAGAKRVIRIKVPVAAHCPLMQPARETFEAALAEVTMVRPACPVYCDADGKAHTEPAEIKALLVEAITSPVRFTDAVLRMRNDGFTTFIETGPGKVLRGLVRQIDAGAELNGVSNDEEATSLITRGNIINYQSEPAGVSS